MSREVARPLKRSHRLVRQTIAKTSHPSTERYQVFNVADHPYTHARVARTLRCAILLWISVISVGSWLPFLRSLFDGDSYRWMHGYWCAEFRGHGVHGDFWLPCLEVAVATAILWLGWRNRSRIVLYPLLIAVQLLLTIDALHSAIVDPDGYRWVGETLGIDIPLKVVGPAAHVSLLFLSIIWVWLDRNTRDRIQPAWRMANTLWVLGLAALLPVQFALLHVGSPRSAQDKIGVLITMVQWLLLPLALMSWDRQAGRSGTTWPHEPTRS